VLTEICQYLHNWFIKDRTDIHLDTFKIENGAVVPSFEIKQGQYFRIIGSTFNDGVYKFPTNDLKDEIFDGAVWTMHVPPQLITLSEEIKGWTDTNSSNTDNIYESESFAGYTYKLRTGANGGNYTWKDAFNSKLKAYKKL